MARIFILLSLVSTLSLAENWKQESSPKLNFLELNGYFRARMDLWSRCDLRTFVPDGEAPGVPAGGTSGCPVPQSYSDSENKGKSAFDRPGTVFSNNMRLRIEPTLNVTEEIRIKAQADIFDNVVLGNAPGLFAGNGVSPSYPYSFITGTVWPAQMSFITFKRAWAEIDTPVGEIRFGRQPLNWGMGVLYNAGNDITNDYGDNVDGVTFITQLWGHYVIPGIYVSYSPDKSIQRGGGLGDLGNQKGAYKSEEWGQRYNLDPSTNIYSLNIGFAKKDKEADIKALLSDGHRVLNYGAMGTYRFRTRDSSNIGLLSLWTDFHVEKFHIEGEAVGIAGKIGNANGLCVEANDPACSGSLTILQAGVAMRSRYGFLNDALGVGLDAGWASGDSAFGMGARPAANNRNPKKGDADGQQFGGSDTNITNFRFNPDYRIDLLLFREIIGTVTDAFYIKPHIGYDITKSFGARLDIISSFTNFKESAPGQSNLLGLEFDASLYYKSEQGIYAMVQYGLLIPFSGLNHGDDKVINNQELMKQFGTARVAHAFQLFAGVAF